jgi:pterin-4a-carbinolamine dehydratase
MNRRNFLKSSFFLSSAGFLLPKSINFRSLVGLDDDYEIKKCKEKLASLDLLYKNFLVNEIISYVGKSFIGIPYEAGTLDVNVNKEELIIKVTGLDCVTFVENTLAMSRLIKKGDTSFDAFKDELKLIRYRDGIIDNYPSRLHYFTDWIYDNQRKGLVEDITKEIGGKKYDKNINFMTTHTGSYKQLKTNPEYVNSLQAVEDEINQRQLYNIPKSSVDKYYDTLKTGDIIATTTDINGLDVTHTGYIYKDDSGTYFLHASIVKKEVIITEVELKEYLMGNKKQTGIIVARPMELNS